MKTFIILSLLVAVTICAPHQRVLKEETAKTIAEKASWESYKFDENPFKDYNDDQIHSLVGVRLKYDKHTLHLLVDNDEHTKDFPTAFNSVTQWPECALPVRNQEHCGSCWAFSGAEVLSDRFCIASQGKIKSVLSPQDMVSCDSSDHGCNGGMLDTTWGYLEKTGIVTEECLPYVSGDGKNIPHCPHGQCADSKFTFVKFRAEKSGPLTCSTQIKEDLMKYGPVQTGFMVYEDFMHYKSGVYEHLHGEQLGGHAVKIVGWGTENGKEHWIAQNSWGPTWGEQGFFRIAFGQCLFDENAYAGQAKVSDFSTPSQFLFYQ